MYEIFFYLRCRKIKISPLLIIFDSLTSKLKQHHGQPHFFNMKGRGVNVWYIEEFKAQDEPHDLPEFNDNLL